jgi:hypothetical protein
MKFVAVNGRTPRLNSYCAMCCEAITGDYYLREIATQRFYCDYGCYVDHCKTTILKLQYHARAS